MAFDKILELQSILIEQEQVSGKQEEVMMMFESVDKFLGHLVANLNHAETPFEGEESEKLAAQLAALQLLGRKDDREVLDDFAKLDPSGVSKQFFKFLQQIDDPRALKDFTKNRSADELLIAIGNDYAPSKVEEWKKVIDAAVEGDEKAKGRLKEAVTKLFSWYQKQLNALKTHFGVGGSFDPIVPDPVK
jgi:hypothetical protein